MNIIRFWGANTESRKTAARVDSGRNYATKKGRFTGGVVAYGYRLVPTGKLDRKNRMINEFIKDPFESGVVQDIYGKLIDENMSLHEIAVYLNEDRQLRTRQGRAWSTSTLRNILKNPLYKGYMSYGKTRMKEIPHTISDEVTKEAFLDVQKRQQTVPPEQWILAQEANPDYQIVSETRWQLAQEILARRSKKYKNTLEPSKDRTWKSSLLLAGLLECGYCHGRISPAVSSGKVRRADDSAARNRTEYYKCNTRGRDKRLCPAKSYLSRHRLEQTVLEEVDYFWERLEQTVCFREVIDCQTLLQEAAAEQERLVCLKRECRRAKEDVEKCRHELYRAVIGESGFDHKYINECLKMAEDKEARIRKETEVLEKSIQTRQLAADTYLQTKEIWPYWRAVFEGAPLNIRKKLLSMLIENIVVTENEMDIYFKVKIENFLHKS